jgi:hypothetical protein
MQKNICYERVVFKKHKHVSYQYIVDSKASIFLFTNCDFLKACATNKGNAYGLLTRIRDI